MEVLKIEGMRSGEPQLAVVTGAASGIGLATSERLRREGLLVVMVDRDDRVHERAKALPGTGPDAVARVLDLSQHDALKAFVDEVVREFGRCHVLVNNAGVAQIDPRRRMTLERTSLAEWDYVQAINVLAPFFLCQGFLPLMKRQRWGRIVNIASRAARTPIRGVSVTYHATKAALLGLTRALALDAADQGVTVNAICPGRIETPLQAMSAPDVIAEYMRSIPAGRLGQPQELAGAVAFLCRDDAAYVNGAILDVNGGSFMP